MADKTGDQFAQDIEIVDPVTGNRAGVTAANELQVTMLPGSGGSTANSVDTDNSTTTPLGISGVFTGTATDVTAYGTISISIFADVNSAAGGIRVEFSSDGTNWDNGDNYFYDTATPTRYLTFGTVAKWFRVVYTNGGTGQAAFRLQTFLHATAMKPSSHKLDGVITPDNDAELSIAVMTGKDIATANYLPLSIQNGQLLVKAEVVSSSTTLAGKRYIARTGSQIHQTGLETSEVLVRNPTGSTKNLIIDRQFLSSQESGSQVIFRLHRNSVTNTQAITFTAASNLVVYAGHPFENGDNVRFSIITTTTGISINIDYFVVNKTNGDFQVSLTSGGAPLALTNNGTGTILLIGNPITPENALIGNATATVMQLWVKNRSTALGVAVQEYVTTGVSFVDETAGRIVVPPAKDVLLSVETGNLKLWSYNIAWIEEAL